MKDFISTEPLLFELVLTAASVVAGTLGALLGLGGGIIIVPFLTLIMGVNIQYAIGASLVSVIATSSGAAATYVRERWTNVKLGLWLEIGTTLGAVSGAYLTSKMSTSQLYLLFSVLLTFSAYSMFRKRNESDADALPIPQDRLADRLGLHSFAPLGEAGKLLPYRVTRSSFGLLLMYFAGLASALLGIGSGILKVPAMDQAMRVPIKVSTATSNFMIGVTAATSAGIYFTRGEILPVLAGPVALGVLMGSKIGTRLLSRWSTKSIRILFFIVLIIVAIQMGVKGVEFLR